MGKVIAERFAEEKVTVFINDVDIKEAEKVASYITFSGLEAFTLKADVSNSSEVEKMVNKIIEKCRRIDILVNNAAVFAESIPIVES